jgi:hypothetical protein
MAASFLTSGEEFRLFLTGSNNTWAEVSKSSGKGRRKREDVYILG